MIRTELRSAIPATVVDYLEKNAWLKQMFKYGFVGVFNTTLDAGLYFILSRWVFSLQLVAKAISYSVGVTNSFYWNRSWTFKSAEKSPRLFTIFVAAHLFGIGVNTTAMKAGLILFDANELAALVLATGISFLFNFSLAKFLVFKK